MPWTIYDFFKLNQDIGTNVVNLASDTLKCMLVTSAYSPNTQTDEFVSTPQSYEVPVSATGYTSGGLVLTGQSYARLAGTDIIQFSCSDIVFAQDSAGGFTTAYYAVIYKATGSFGTSPVICYASFGANKSNVGGAITLKIDPNGIWQET